MLKQKTYDVSQTNIAQLGSDLEKKVRLAASEHEEAWKNAGKAVGLEIWRVEKFHIVPVPKNTYGTFYDGDSYIVLNTFKKNPAGDALAWDLHFWLGASTTQDEAGTAAYKTVELDDHLHGAPVQHREVEHFESNLFLGYFPKGIRILSGGFDTGFHHVGPASYKPRLLQFKGKRHIRVTEVPLSHKSLNSGDVFLLDAGLKLFIWQGKQASGLEKNKAVTLGEAIETEREGKAKVEVFAEGEEDASFWELLGGKGEVASAAAGGSDLEADHDASHLKQLHRLHEDKGKFTFSKVSEGEKFKRSDLDSSDVFILDTGFEVIAWIGKGSSVGEKKHALQYAQEYLTAHGKNPALPISKMIEGAENNVFSQIVH